MVSFSFAFKKAIACASVACAGALVAIALCAGPACAVEILYSGNCGANAQWTVDADGNMIVSGTGNVCKFGYGPLDNLENFTHYSFGSGSGYTYMKHVATSITVEEGITSIDDNVFTGYLKLTSVSLPASVTQVASKAFNNCRVLESVSFAAGSRLQALGDSAFCNCRSLKSVALPADLASIGASAFEKCGSLGAVALGRGSALASVGSRAFADCTALRSLNLYAAKGLRSVAADALQGVPASLAVGGAKVLKHRKLAVSWGAVPGATSYRLYYKPAKGKGKYRSVKLGGASTSKTLSKLKAKKKYKVYVEAMLGSTVLSKSAVRTTKKVKK